jgi:hypothetical protein
MKALALNTVIGLIIGIASLLVLLILFSGSFKPFGNWMYCNLYLKFALAFNPKLEVPQFCHLQSHVKTEYIQTRDNTEFSRELLAYIIACWKNAEIEGLDRPHLCYELRLNPPIQNVTEYNVTQILIREDNCQSIENSDYGCGEQNNILWNVSENVIENQTILLIKYVPDKNAVEVIG